MITAETLGRVKKYLFTEPDVVGVGKGKDEIVVFYRQVPLERAVRCYGIPLKGIISGDIRAMALRTDKWRPAPGGVSIGHYAITAGTLGCIVKDATTGQRLILSNNHVLANSNNAKTGDPVEQPGPYDQNGGGNGGDDSNCPFSLAVTSIFNLFSRMLFNKTRLRAIVPREEDFSIATLERFIPIAFDGSVNIVDCAVAKPLKDSDVLDEIIDVGTPNGWIGVPSVGTTLKKSGRTTGLTKAAITAVDATIKVSYGSNLVAIFEDQIVTGSMCAGGDSGSLVLDESNHAIGLLFAGSDTTTIINPIQLVLEKLKVKFS